MPMNVGRSSSTSAEDDSESTEHSEHTEMEKKSPKTNSVVYKPKKLSHKREKNNKIINEYTNGRDEEYSEESDNNIGYIKMNKENVAMENGVKNESDTNTTKNNFDVDKENNPSNAGKNKTDNPSNEDKHEEDNPSNLEKDKKDNPSDVKNDNNVKPNNGEKKDNDGEGIVSIELNTGILPGDWEIENNSNVIIKDSGEETNTRQNVSAENNLKVVTDRVDVEEYDEPCPEHCPAQRVMVCARCKDGIYRTFISVCHMRKFNCLHPDEKVELVSRTPCVLSAPYLLEAPAPKNKISEPGDVDQVLRFIRCREKKEDGDDSDARCNFD